MKSIGIKEPSQHDFHDDIGSLLFRIWLEILFEISSDGLELQMTATMISTFNDIYSVYYTLLYLIKGTPLPKAL